MAFSDDVVQKVWEKGEAVYVDGKLSPDWRKDQCGAWISRKAYGDRNSSYGWEVDHIKPVAKGGSDDLGNLHPLYWETNRDKSDTYPWQC